MSLCGTASVIQLRAQFLEDLLKVTPPLLDLDPDLALGLDLLRAA